MRDFCSILMLRGNLFLHVGKIQKVNFVTPITLR